MATDNQTEEQQKTDTLADDYNLERQEDNCKNDLDNALTLEVLPNEIILQVCQFLDARFVIRVLSLVCQSFYGVFSGDMYWKIRIGKRWRKKYPAIPGTVSPHWMVDILKNV